VQPTFQTFYAHLCSAHRSPRPPTTSIMLASTSSRDYIALRNSARDPMMSPSCRSRHYTPPRYSTISSNPPLSPMLTPSPLRQRLFAPDQFYVDLDGPDDFFMQSPYKSAAQAQQPGYTINPQLIPPDDENGSISCSSSSPFSPFFPTSDSQPLRTPVKQTHRVPGRSALSPIYSSSSIGPDPSSVARVGVGTKRKSTPHTPLEQHTLTPLVVTSISNSATGPLLDRLAPLPAPKFSTGTPQTKAETDAYLQCQTATLTTLRITDLHDSGDEFGGIEDDSGCEMDDDDHCEVLFTGSMRLKASTGNSSKASRHGPPLNKGKGKEQVEVAEAVSPGGHVNKRRARSRPLSAELLESVKRSPSQNKVGDFFQSLLETADVKCTSILHLLQASGISLTA
jgi:mitosis inhibitor protein kinase SWE1